MKVAEERQLSLSPGFWDDNKRATEILKNIQQNDYWVKLYEATESAVEDFVVLFDFWKAGDATDEETKENYENALQQIEDAEFKSTLNQPEDELPAVLQINSGAGGTESQDWSEMLARMYRMYGERQGWKVTELDWVWGDGAGIKTCTLQFDGPFAYGFLKAESGVHRLVRISPFDSNARRHTSFASVFVYPQVDDEIKIDIQLDDLRIDTFRSGGAGGQHVNMTDSAVRITHFPTGIVVQCQNERSQHKNRDTAMKQLRARLYEFELEKKREETRKTEASKLEINFGSQIRSYVLAPYRMIKDHRTKLAVGDVDRVLNGDLEPLLHAYLVWRKTGKTAGEATDLPE